jgi:ribosomal protein S25
MKYFESFPLTSFTLDSNSPNANRQLVTNILARSTFLREIANNTSIAYEYNVKESDTAEIIAHKVYGDAYRGWIILLFNNIINPFYDWPLKSDALDNYIFKKYGQDIDTARSTIHHYEKETTKKSVYNGLLIDEEVTTQIISEYQLNYTTNVITPTALPTVADTSVAVSSETVTYPTYTLTIDIVHKAVSNYTYEFNQNEQRRKIKILDEKFVQRIEDEFRNLMTNG